MFTKYRLFPILIVILFLLFCTPLLANDIEKRQVTIQAVYLYNFLKFVKWPNNKSFFSSHNTYEICIIGQDPFGSLLDSFKKKKIKNKEINIQYFSSSKQLQKCHLVFVGQTNNESYTDVLKKLENTGSLTVSSMKHFAQDGGVIGFVLNNEKVGFNINKTKALQQGLEINAKLLELAISIY